jgi:hypothetical protein
LVLQLLDQLDQLGQTAHSLKQSLSGQSFSKELAEFASLSGQFWGLQKVPSPEVGKGEEDKS